MDECDVLVVEDDADIRTLLVEELRQDGFRVECAPNGEQALACLDRLRPGLVLLDLMMPRVSGWQVLEWLRHRPETAALPVLVMTAGGQDGPPGELLLHKPFAIEELLALVRVLARAGWRRRPAAIEDLAKAAS